jgi:hypothetical protein
MTRPEFERQMAEFRDRIAELPEAQRGALEEMVRETIARDEQIHRSSLEGSRALERLELAFERLGDACQRLVALANDAQRTVERANAHRHPEPGLN